MTRSLVYARALDAPARTRAGTDMYVRAHARARALGRVAGRMSSKAAVSDGLK